MSGRVLLYGATGFTGAEIAAMLAGKVDLVIAGRSEARVSALGAELRTPWRSFDLSDERAIDIALEDIDLVLHAAGPFGTTARPMMHGCLRNSVDYIDLGGEWPVFVEAMGLDAAAREAGTMILPGIGLTVAASDCLMATAMQRWPETTRLCLGISRAQIISRGSVESAAAMMSPNVIVRKDGALATIPAGSLVRAFDFGEGLSEATAMSWADVVTAGLMTGVDAIEVYSEMRWAERASYRLSGMTMDVFGAEPAKLVGKALAQVWPEGPSMEDRGQASFVMEVHAIDPWRRERRLSMRTRDGYSFSVLTAVDAVHRVLAGEGAAGFQTPALAFGADFIFEADAARLEPVHRPDGSVGA
ncbi:saccharopine dehydrogenase NADP-binding domain-containing protein [Qipengyuania sp. XHP0207]|uniref:saccharopine dehydrogenase family protein n=1 Tax=Qipengyuania sp. XHP0207 TaxID=3038078 RepID=UPI00241CCB6A|nr:saccharopine dehydrogenase NADP-binding domain-containing protein [Qipengyuania sp. XHP0207]MDG5747598.1 saccharopine dehydrogenase NADP-binding domain-containing protein [Qipengyuania sp. XHP0207]